MKRSAIHRDLRTPKYRPRIIVDRKKRAAKRACRKDKMRDRRFAVALGGAYWPSPSRI